MSRKQYYSKEELATATQKLIRNGKPLWAMADDPKCPLDIAIKLRKLKELMFKPAKNNDDGR